MIIITIYDKQADTYSNPAVSVNRATACRDFGSLINTPNTQPHQYPADFDLLEVGSWDAATGSLKPLEQSLKLANGSDYVKPNEN